MNTTALLILLVVLLIIIVIVLTIVERLFKSNPKKSESKKNLNENFKELKTEITPKVENVPSIKIYNSELADDLHEIIEKTEQEPSSRLKLEKYMNKEGNISRYIKRKNYQEFDFGSSDDNSVDETENTISFTIDDYKRIMALSNIDDKK